MGPSSRELERRYLTRSERRRLRELEQAANRAQLSASERVHVAERLGASLLELCTARGWHGR